MLQQQVLAEVAATQQRSGFSIQRTLSALGVSPSSYYRWQREEPGTGEAAARLPQQLVQCFEATIEEKRAVRKYACQHTELRHREMAFRMVDENVAYLSPSTVYRVLKEFNLVSPWKRRSKRQRAYWEQAQRPNERWGTDLMYLRIGVGQYYLVTFLDEYSRYLVHWELLTDMSAISVSLAAEKAVSKEQIAWQRKEISPPQIRSDNGSCYISREFKSVLTEHGLAHQRIRPHCPEENGLVERSNRTLRTALEELPLDNRQEAEETIERVVRWYNDERLHSSLKFLRPQDYYRGNPAHLTETRRLKLAQARHHRREQNLGLQQTTLPLEPTHSAY